MLSEKRPAVADAWLLSVEALGQAAAGDRCSADQALTASRTATETLAADQEPAPGWQPGAAPPPDADPADAATGVIVTNCGSWWRRANEPGWPWMTNPRATRAAEPEAIRP